MINQKIFKIFCIYHLLSDTFLAYIVTLDSASTRFHACERFNRCSFVAVEDDPGHLNATSTKGKRVVYVNPVNMDIDKWEEYMEDTKARLLSGEEINILASLFRCPQHFSHWLPFSHS